MLWKVEVILYMAEDGENDNEDDVRKRAEDILQHIDKRHGLMESPHINNIWR